MNRQRVRAGQGEGLRGWRGGQGSRVRGEVREELGSKHGGRMSKKGIMSGATCVRVCVALPYLEVKHSGPHDPSPCRSEDKAGGMPAATLLDTWPWSELED